MLQQQQQQQHLHQQQQHQQQQQHLHQQQHHQQQQQHRYGSQHTAVTTGGGYEPTLLSLLTSSESALTDKLLRVGAVASHTSVRLDNPFDSDRSRHKATHDHRCTPAMAALLAPMQAVPVAQLTAASNQAEDSGSLADTPRDLDMFDPVAPDAPANEVVFSHPTPTLEPSSNNSNALQQSTKSPDRTFCAPAETTRTGRKTARASKLEEELEARLEAVAEERQQRRKEHLFRMRMMRAEGKERKAINDQKLKNAEAKSLLLKLKVEHLKKQLQ
ncbi:AT-rich binding protein [Rhipicephalus sanguineus]|uniref:AT-rich binding protein n=1 Tax=Rhipicephalus sanguineus TaxID=34632 RepID=UPI001895F9F1|nr:AT-rich binding protein [Rhipicephalus sanguineus]